MWLTGPSASAPQPPKDDDLLVALPYPGLSPHYWSARPRPGVSVVSSRRVAASAGAAGAGGYQELALRLAGDIPDLLFDLAIPGQAPVMTRRLTFA